MGQEAAEIWTAQTDSQPGQPKSDRLLASPANAAAIWARATPPPAASLAKHQIADHLRLHAGKHQLSRRAAALIGEHGRELVQQRLLGAHSIGNFSPCSLAQAMASG